MNKKWRIGAVSYLNTRPLLLGLEHAGFKNRIDLVKSYPAKIAQDLIAGQIDIGLVPVAIIPQLTNAHIISKYIIGTNGAVASVALFSEVPITEIKSIYLDYQSKTSVQLLKILLNEHWKGSVNFLVATEGYIDQISGTTAGLIIGDRALENLSKFPYVYDLGLAWKQHTGLPFVFAAWVANQSIPSEFMADFDLANSYGLANLDEVIALVPPNAQVYDLHKYYTENISYAYDDEKKQGLSRFLNALI